METTDYTDTVWKSTALKANCQRRKENLGGPVSWLSRLRYSLPSLIPRSQTGKRESTPAACPVFSTCPH